MKQIILGIAFAAAVLPAMATDVGVTIGIDQPGVYGRIDIGRVPTPPVLIYQQPMVIAPAPIAIHRQPIYMHVPPGHAKNWGKHCGRYNACGQPVYFVHDGWYRDVYQPVYHGGHPHVSDKYERKREKEMRKDEKKYEKEMRKHDKKHHKKNKHDD